MRKIVVTLLSCIALFGWNPVGAGEENRAFRGPYHAEALTFYFDHPGGALSVDFTATRSQLKPSLFGGVGVSAAVLLTTYDADGNVVQKIYRRFPDDEKTLHFRLDFPAAAAGIRQLRAVASRGNGIGFNLKTVPAVKFGLMADRCMLGTAFDGQFSPAWLYVPADAARIETGTRGVRMTVTGRNGRPILSAVGNAAANVQPGEVCQATFQGRGAIGIAGVPGILCPDAATARKIAAGYVAAADGRRFPFRFQARMWNWMQSLKPVDWTIKEVKPSQRKAQWLADPAAAVLIGQDGAFSHVGYLLGRQQLDPSRPDFGFGPDLNYFALYYSLDRPFNPYYRNPQMLNRLLLYQFSHLLRLRSNGTYSDSWSDYSGGDALSTLSTYIAFGLAGKLTPEPLKSLWGNGLSLLIDRFAFSRVSCENQSAHWPVDLYCFYLGSGDPLYRDLARDFCADQANPALNRFLDAGYLQEKYGPDGTYQGLCACNLAFYHRMSGDPNPKKVLQMIYRLMNHTVAPEPDGRMVGASGFAHRTNGSWVQRQWSGGTALMAGILPEAACWNDRKERPDSAVRYRRYLNWPPEGAASPWYQANAKWATGYALSPWLPMWSQYLYPPPAEVQGTFPAVSATRFEQVFGREFYCVRRPGYYAFAYAGLTSGNHFRGSGPKAPLRSGWQRDGNLLRATNPAAKKAGWQPLQGLQMFWTPDYGTAIVAMNWNLYTHQTLRADLPGGKTAWPAVWTGTAQYDAASRSLTIRREMTSLPARVERRIVFSDSGVKVRVRVTPAAGAKFFEQLPYLVKPGMKLEFRRAGTWSEHPGSNVDAIRMSKNGAGVLVVPSRPIAVASGPESHLHETVGLLDLAVVGGEIDYELQPWKNGDRP